MPTGGGFKVACFGSGLESACCTSDLYLAQCYDPFCEECVVDGGSSTGYGGVFPKSCVSGSQCLGCQSGGYTCPGECKCQPGSGCGCFQVGTYTPMACTGGGCVESQCSCCLSGSLVDRITNFTISNIGYSQVGPVYSLLSFNWSYIYSSCNDNVSEVLIRIVKKPYVTGTEVVMGYIPTTGSLPLASSSGVWTGSILVEAGDFIYADLTLSSPSGVCTLRRTVINL